MTWVTNNVILQSILGISLFYFMGKLIEWVLPKKQVKLLEYSYNKKKLLDENEYKQAAERRFLASYCEVDCEVNGEDKSKTSRHAEKYNTNIESIFYLRALYQEAIKDPENELEKTWKRRILMESTPRGNIIMYYDAFKRAFSYYSDVSMPYSLLNAVCMKYVLMYRCRDFFVDQYIIPPECPIVLHKIHFDEEVDADKEKKKEEMKMLVSKGPFLKPKNVQIQQNTLTKSLPNTLTKSLTKSLQNTLTNTLTKSLPKFLPKDLVKNKIIRIGRLSNFQPLIKDKLIPKKVIKQNSSENDFVVVKSYSDFKKWRSPNTNIFD